MTSAPDPVRVLVVDDDPAVALVLGRILAGEGYAVESVCDGESAFTAIAACPPDVVLLDVRLPGIDGLELCRRLKLDAVTRLIPVVLITGLSDPEDRVRGREAGADDFLVKPIEKRELLARVRSLARVKRYTDDLDSAASIVMTLAMMIEARTESPEGHCYRLANHATALGRKIGLSSADLTTLHRGGFLHDIGMLAIPDSLLLRPARLEPEEFERVKSHTVIGDQLCGNLRSLQPVRPIVRHHHERLDGSGYPDGLRGGNVPLLAQIVGIVDVYEAMTHPRPYQPPATMEEASFVLREQVEKGWRDGELVETFIALLEEKAMRPNPAGQTEG